MGIERKSFQLNDMNSGTFLVAIGFFFFALIDAAKGGSKIFRELAKSLNGVASKQLGPTLPNVIRSTDRKRVSFRATLKISQSVKIPEGPRESKSTVESASFKGYTFADESTSSNLDDFKRANDEEFYRSYFRTQHDEMNNYVLTFFKPFMGWGQLLSAQELVQKIANVENVAEDEYIDSWVDFKNEFEVFLVVRACLLNPSRKRTLKEFMQAFGKVIDAKISGGMIAWFFHELNGPFDEAAIEMTLAMLYEMGMDINAPYKGKTALQYALENFNVDAVAWIWKNGGHVDHSKRDLFVKVRADVNISESQLIKLHEVLHECNLDQIIRYRPDRRQFKLIKGEILEWP